jgi:outer membrane protein assembly factor BamA
MNNIYSQFVKFTSDLRYYRNGYNKSLVIRLYAGIGLSYGNSIALPYVEQFFSGGAYSVRGWTARYLGPGSYYEEDLSGYIDQSGDIKLENNIEFRFDMSKMLKGALFIDVGNIWLVNEDPNRPGADFNFDTFYDQLAVSTGFGIRFDFNFFVLRTDFGIPLRYPYPINNEYWLLGTGNIFSSTNFHLAIGYPF